MGALLELTLVGATISGLIVVSGVALQKRLSLEPTARSRGAASPDRETRLRM